MEQKTITKTEEREYYDNIRENFNEGEVVKAKNLFLPLKPNNGIIFGKSEKFEYTKSKTFGLVKVFFQNNTKQYIHNKEYFDNDKKYIKSGIYEKPYYTVDVFCENGFKFSHKIYVKNSLTKINEDTIKNEIRPIFEKKLKEIKKKKILRNIDNLINSYHNQEIEFLSIDHI